MLLALLDLEHVHHGRARRGFEDVVEAGWASCAITQNGYVRIASQTNYPGRVSPAEGISRLRGATRTEYHRFWSCDLSLLSSQAVTPERLLGPHQVTDVYLLALAVGHGGRLVTLDRSVALSAVPGATEQDLIVL